MHNGGVCKDLDYKVDQMTDYVAEMAQRLILPNNPVSGPFRKFVSQILTSTRLPSTTILLGMNYLARRTNILKAGTGKPENEPWKPTDGQVWRMLTIGLLLGSKFLDDNTFQNRSWSEVSGIPVKELNIMELEWLNSLNWLMYVNLDKSEDFTAWLADWQSWREKKDMQNKATLDRLAPLAPIDTNVQRPRPYQQPYSAYPKAASRERPQSGSTSALEYYQQAQNILQVQAAQAGWAAHSALTGNSYPTPQLTPESAAGSGYNTPEYPSATGGGPRFNDWSVYQPYIRGYQQTPAHSARSTYVAPRVASYLTPIHNYPHGYGGNAWDWNLSDTTSCSCCGPNAHSKQPYISHGYVGQQIAA